MSGNTPTITPPPAQDNPPSGSHTAPLKPMSGMAVAGFTLAVIALVLGWIPIINNLAFVLAILGLIFAIVGMIATRRTGRKRGRGLAIAGLVIALLAGGLVIAAQNAASKAIDTAFDDAISRTASGGTHAGKTEKKDTSRNMEGDIDDGKYHIRLVSVTRSDNDFEGKPTAILTYELTNKQQENSNFMDVTVNAFQNGRQLDTAIYTQAPAGYDANSSMTTLQPGATGTVTVAYTLEDESPLTVEASGTVDMSKTKVTGRFDL